ncbi:2399_t:CDS:1, partial [Racocetra fulgida]
GEGGVLLPELPSKLSTIVSLTTGIVFTDLDGKGERLGTNGKDFDRLGGGGRILIRSVDTSRIKTYKICLGNSSAMSE